MVKHHKVVFLKKAPKGYKVGEAVEITDSNKNKYLLQNYNMTYVNSPFWKDEVKPKSKKKKTSKEKDDK